MIALPEVPPGESVTFWWLRWLFDRSDAELPEAIELFTLFQWGALCVSNPRATRLEALKLVLDNISETYQRGGNWFEDTRAHREWAEATRG